MRLSLLAVVLLVACRGDQMPRRSAKTPVIIISIDTLRSDHLPVYGYQGVTTPHIDGFRADAVLFERAYSHVPLTLPSHATMLTGLLPADTGLRDNLGFRLAPGVRTLPELLKQNGYVSGAAVSAYVMKKESGISRGFDSYDDDIGGESATVSISQIQRDGMETAAVARRWIEKHRDRPFFFLFHIYEPHTPYSPPEPYRSRYSDPYDGEIARADEVTGRFLEDLKSLDLYDKALIILLSDHGEGLGDHGEDEHGIFLYREAIQVPLVVKFPKSRLRGRSVDAPVQMVDLFPTIVEQTQTRSPGKSGPGQSLLTFLDSNRQAERAIYSESYYPRFHFGWSDLHSLITGGHHYIQAPEPELYDLARDPAEKRNILRENRRVFAALRKSIQPLIREPAAPQSVDPEEAAKLAALGYLGSAVTAPGEALPDPKGKTATFRQIREAFKLFRAEKFEEALVVYRQLLDENPRMLDLWDISARALMRLDRNREAISAAKEGLKLSPQTTHLALLIANLALKEGDLDEARNHAALALKSDPQEAHEILARVALAGGDVSTAEKEARLSLEGQKSRVAGMMTLARIEVKKENFDAALVWLDHAAETLRVSGKQSVNNLNFLRGDVLARLGRSTEAEAAFREEIRLFPEETQAYKNLILLQVAGGRNEEATRLIYELEKAYPAPPAYLAIVQTLRVLGDERGARFWARRGLQRFPGDRNLRKAIAG